MKLIICLLVTFLLVLFASAQNFRALGEEVFDIEHYDEEPRRLKLETLRVHCEGVPKGARIFEQCTYMLTQKASYDPAPLIALGPSGAKALFTVMCPDIFQAPGIDLPPERIQQLIKELGSESYATRTAASTALGQAGAQSGEEMLAASKSKNPEIRMRAGQILAQWKSAGKRSFGLHLDSFAQGFEAYCNAVEDPLLKDKICNLIMQLIEKEDAGTRNSRFLDAGLRCVIGSPNPALRKQLLDLVTNGEAATARLIATLAAKNGADSLKLLQAALERGDPNVSQPVLRMNPPAGGAIIEPLLPLIKTIYKDTNHPGRVAAAGFLARSGEDDAIAPLIAALTESAAQKREATWHLAMLGRSGVAAPPALIHALAEIRTNLAAPEGKNKRWGKQADQNTFLELASNFSTPNMLSFLIDTAQSDAKRVRRLSIDCLSMNQDQEAVDSAIINSTLTKAAQNDLMKHLKRFR